VQPTGLPIEPVLPDVARALRDSGAAVLQAPPGAGKTTVVPLALLEEPWLAGRKILLLEPRRLAARAAARRMADLRGERVGETVGYRIRRDSTVGPRTRIEVVTEGILTRMLQSDASLEPYGLVIFDEFHERSIHADLGLALTLQSRAILRADLRLLVMSATLEGGPISALLGDAPVITSEGRSFPVETRYLPRRADTWIEPAVAAAIRQALAEGEGDVLAFLPGQAEIRRTEELLEGGADTLGATSAGRNWSVHPLYGNLSQAEQDAALRPAPAGRRKVVLATSIAETSLTIEGVRIVIDSGLARVPKFSPGTGMTRLTTVRVSRASADQRRGRAGRTAPGRCYRLWAKQEDHHLLPRTTPEILEADLASFALDLAAAGVEEPGDLRWLDPPPAAALAEARLLLRQLDALGAAGRISPHGRRLAELGTHPRLAHMLVRGAELGAASLAADLAALLEERDFLRGAPGSGDADLQLRIDLLGATAVPAEYHGLRVDRGTFHRVREEARAWRQAIRSVERQSPTREPPGAGSLLAFAYPDRLGQRRTGQAGRFLLRNGQGVHTDSPGLLRADFLVAADLDGDRRESRIWLGAPLTLEEIEAHFGSQITVESVVEWDDRTETVIAARRERLGALVLAEQAVQHPDPESVAVALLAWLRRAGIDALPWTDGAKEIRQRIAFLYRALGAPWPDVSDSALLGTLDQWLAPGLGKVRRRADLGRVDLGAALLTQLGWEERKALDTLAPTHLVVPTGSRIPVSYDDPAAPVLAVRLQEVFGLTETPRVAGGRVPVTMQLLSPAHRPVQVTQDLAGFWRTSYFDVRKEMKGRYPKHVWPDNPLEAAPTRRAKPRGT
jgi:ATP-dependent helicase HrpB